MLLRQAFFGNTAHPVNDSAGRFTFARRQNHMWSAAACRRFVAPRLAGCTIEVLSPFWAGNNERQKPSVVVASCRASPAALYEKSTVTLSNSRLLHATALTTKRGGLLDRYFYLLMSLLIPAVVAYGFSFTVGAHLIHPAIPRPLILYLHAVVFSS